LVHELTHVWQISHRPELGVIAEAAENKVTEFTQGKAAEYIPGPPGQPFGWFNLEQQASIVEFWYAGKQAFHDAWLQDSSFGVGSISASDAQNPFPPVSDDMADPYFKYIIGNIRAGIP
jgi:hypothetical protein